MEDEKWDKERIKNVMVENMNIEHEENTQR